MRIRPRKVGMEEMGELRNTRKTRKQDPAGAPNLWQGRWEHAKHKMNDLFKKALHAIRIRWSIRYLLLAIPGILLPTYDGMSMSGQYFRLGFPSLGWLTVSDDYSISFLIGCFMGNIIPLGKLCLIWIPLIYYACILRKWASKRNHMIGPIINALTISLYAFLCFFFLLGFTHMLWEACLQPMSSFLLEKAFTWTSIIFPVACIIAACLPLSMIWLDSLAWRGLFRVPYIITGLISVMFLACLARAIPFHVNQFEEMAQIFRTMDNMKQESSSNPSQGTHLH